LTYISLIVGDPRGILHQQLRLHPIHLLNIFSTLSLIILLNIIKFKKNLRTITNKVRNGTHTIEQLWRENGLKGFVGDRKIVPLQN
jgi:hypothetical protein